jgi:hypothetical protein
MRLAACAAVGFVATMNSNFDMNDGDLGAPLADHGGLEGLSSELGQSDARGKAFGCAANDNVRPTTRRFAMVVSLLRKVRHAIKEGEGSHNDYRPDRPP